MELLLFPKVFWRLNKNLKVNQDIIPSGPSVGGEVPLACQDCCVNKRNGVGVRCLTLYWQIVLCAPGRLCAIIMGKEQADV